MTDTGPVGIASTVTIAGHPLHPLLVTVPIGLWVGTLICDIAFVSTGDGFWARAALIVLISAIVFALVAALAGFADFFGNAQIRAISDAWQHMLGNLIAVVLSFINLWPHWDATGASISPWGLVLSAVTVLLLLFNGWKGGELVFRHHVGMVPSKPKS